MLSPGRIRDLAREFRKVVAELAPTMGVSFSSFPRGSCGDVALMMMEYLASNGASNLTYLSGRRADGDDGYHAWCVVDGVAVDLTGNQFDEGRPAVFVGSAWDPWLATWSDRNPPLRYSDPGFASFAAPSLAMGYARIVEALDARRTSLR